MCDISAISKNMKMYSNSRQNIDTICDTTYNIDRRHENVKMG